LRTTRHGAELDPSIINLPMPLDRTARARARAAQQCWPHMGCVMSRLDYLIMLVLRFLDPWSKPPCKDGGTERRVTSHPVAA